MSFALEKAITGRKPRPGGRRPPYAALARAVPCADHLGREFPSLAAMAAAWGQPYKRFERRLAIGWEIERALTAPGSCRGRAAKKRPKVIPSRVMRSVDHTGREFPSLQAMCDFWGVTPSRYRGLRKRGHTLEEALTPPEYHRRKICRDHTGREFPSLQAMCDFWHIHISTYHNRVRDGLPLKAVLTSPVRRKAKNDA